MLKDQFHLPLTGARPDTVSRYNAYVDAFLSYGADVRAIFDAADDAPDCMLANAHAAGLHMALEGAEGFSAAAPYLDRAKAHAAAATEREQAFLAAVKAWADMDFHGALNHLTRLAEIWPQDLCALKWAQYHAFNLGDAEALLHLGKLAVEAHAGAPFAHGLYAFALEQNHRLDEAEAEGLRAVEIRVDDAWAQHAVAHVMDAAGRHEDGAKWLDHCAHTWDQKGVFIRIHNWWHAALFRLNQGRTAEALEIYDTRLWGEWPEFPQEQIGAASMLWRLEMRGVDVGDRWRPVVEQVRARAGEHILPFHDLHYLYALARAGNEAEAEDFCLRIEQRADAGPAAPIWRNIAAPAGRGILAFARGRYAEATDALSDALPQLHRIGGSHAQRHVFVEAFERAKQATGARTLQGA